MIHHLQSSLQRLLILHECMRLMLSCLRTGLAETRRRVSAGLIKEWWLKCPSNGQCGALRVCIHCSVDPCNWYSTGNSILVQDVSKDKCEAADSGTLFVISYFISFNKMLSWHEQKCLPACKKVCLTASILINDQQMAHDIFPSLWHP